MGIEGTWNIVLHTPMGKQKGKMNVAVDGSELTGDIKSPMGAFSIEEGKLDGNSATWICSVNTPISMKLGFSVSIDGDDLNGTVKVGPMGTNAVEGKRAS